MTPQTGGDPMKILITGANGFVGGYLAALLHESGDEVSLTDLAPARSTGPAAGGLDLPYRSCDLTSGKQAEDLIAASTPDAIVHLAAQSSTAVSFSDPVKTFEVNVIGTLNLLEAAKTQIPEARILLTGSSDEYGVRDRSEMPLSEDAPIEPASPYAASKAAQGTMALQYHRSFGSRVIVTRSFSHTGPGQAGRFVLPSFARQCAAVAAGAAPPAIKTGDLSVERDFLDVRDVVRAYAALLKKGKAGVTYNGCSGESLRLGQALELLIAMTGIEITVETDPSLLRPADVPVLIGDNSRLKEDTGWSREIGVDEMLGDLYEWWLDRGLA